MENHWPYHPERSISPVAFVPAYDQLQKCFTPRSMIRNFLTRSESCSFSSNRWRPGKDVGRAQA
jgi:hypothetical protein